MKAYFTWSANSEPDLAGYKIYQGSSTGSYSTSHDVGNVTTGWIDVDTFDSVRYFALTAYNDGAEESSFSTEIQRTFTKPVGMFR